MGSGGPRAGTHLSAAQATDAVPRPAPLSSPEETALCSPAGLHPGALGLAGGSPGPHSKDSALGTPAAPLLTRLSPQGLPPHPLTNPRRRFGRDKMATRPSRFPEARHGGPAPLLCVLPVPPWKYDCVASFWKRCGVRACGRKRGGGAGSGAAAPGGGARGRAGAGAPRAAAPGAPRGQMGPASGKPRPGRAAGRFQS